MTERFRPRALMLYSGGLGSRPPPCNQRDLIHGSPSSNPRSRFVNNMSASCQLGFITVLFRLACLLTSYAQLLLV